MTTKVTSSVLANTSIVSGTYGGTNIIPVFVVDAQGRLTSSSNVAVSFSYNSIAITGTSTINGVEIGYRHIPQTAVSTSYTLALADASKHIYYTGSTATLTIPLNSSIAFPIGATVTLINNGSGALTISSSATLNFAGTSLTGSRTLATKGLATLIKVGTDTWFISGVGVS